MTINILPEGVRREERVGVVVHMTINMLPEGARR